MKVASQQKTLWAALVGIPFLLAAVVVTQMRIDARAQAAQGTDELVLTSPSTIQKLSLGYDGLLADIYWTRAVQYYGARAGIAGKNFNLLWPLLDITTTLDPKLIVAYRFGAIFLGQPGTAGPGRVDLAVRLIERGIAQNPDAWPLYSDLGFIQYWQLGNYGAASATYLKASELPNAPVFFKMMAARIEALGGSLETSRMLWSQIYETTTSTDIRKRALTMLEGLKAQQDEEQLNALAEQYRGRFGRAPGSMADLQGAGLLRGTPVDPQGYPYVFGADGRAQLNPSSPVTIPAAPPAPRGGYK